MNSNLNKYKQQITQIVIVLFVLSWLGLIGQSSSHSFMVFENQQHKQMGHDMASHCKPVICDVIISLDDQSAYGLSALSMLDLNMLPAILIMLLMIAARCQWSGKHIWHGYYPPPLEYSGVLRI